MHLGQFKNIVKRWQKAIKLPDDVDAVYQPSGTEQQVSGKRIRKPKDLGADFVSSFPKRSRQSVSDGNVSHNEHFGKTILSFDFYSQVTLFIDKIC